MLRIVGFGEAGRSKVYQIKETAVTKEERQESTELLFGAGKARNRFIWQVGISA